MSICSCITNKSIILFSRKRRSSSPTVTAWHLPHYDQTSAPPARITGRFTVKEPILCALAGIKEARAPASASDVHSQTNASVHAHGVERWFRIAMFGLRYLAEVGISSEYSH